MVPGIFLNAVGLSRCQQALSVYMSPAFDVDLFCDDSQTFSCRVFVVSHVQLRRLCLGLCFVSLAAWALIRALCESFGSNSPSWPSRSRCRGRCLQGGGVNLPCSRRAQPLNREELHATLSFADAVLCLDALLCNSPQHPNSRFSFKQRQTRACFPASPHSHLNAHTPHVRSGARELELRAPESGFYWLLLRVPEQL